MGKEISVPDGDVLIHCGDHTFRGNRSQVENAIRWIGHQPHKYKVIIAGNHDFLLQEKPALVKRFIKRYYPGITYLQDSGVEIDGVKFYGSPWQPWFHDWAFNFAPGQEGRLQARGVWANIPDDTQVLITHGPPYGVLDATLQGDNVGCPDLAFRVAQVRPKLHVFGHIHESYGSCEVEWPDGRTTRYVNAATCTRRYRPTNPAVEIDL
jgi:predicted phosphohydrolase